MSYPQPARQSATRAFNAFNLVAFTIGVKAANIINVAVQLKDARGNNVSGVCAVKAYLSDSADGHTITATVPTSNLAVHTNGVIVGSLTTNKVVELITDASGRFDLDITQTASPVTYYLVVVLPDGSTVISAPIVF
jgi:hypothetical protein